VARGERAVSWDFSSIREDTTLKIGRSDEYFGATDCASPPPETLKPSEISEVFQEVVTTKILKVVPEAGLEPARF
jgi:hypothetical protein